jgi:hypothetical protein
VKLCSTCAYRSAVELDIKLSKQMEYVQWRGFTCIVGIVGFGVSSAFCYAFSLDMSTVTLASTAVAFCLALPFYAGWSGYLEVKFQANKPLVQVPVDGCCFCGLAEMVEDAKT